jgi:DNA-binding MurR/RpiR family transcriptional regulator
MCKAAQRLAAEYGVSEKTIIRDGEFAKALDYLGLSEDNMSGRLKLPKSKVVAMYHEAIGKASADKRVGFYAKISPDAHATIVAYADRNALSLADVVEALAAMIAASG